MSPIYGRQAAIGAREGPFVQFQFTPAAMTVTPGDVMTGDVGISRGPLPARQTPGWHLSR